MSRISQSINYLFFIHTYSDTAVNYVLSQLRVEKFVLLGDGTSSKRFMQPNHNDCDKDNYHTKNSNKHLSHMVHI